MAYQFSKPKAAIQQSKGNTSGFGSAPTAKLKKTQAVKTIVTLVVVILVLAAAVYFLNQYAGLGLFDQTEQKSDWQAVFLDNGQVYFGKVSRTDDSYVILKDIYYLQVVNADGTPVTNNQASTVQQKITLIKLGNEIHGPMDEMRINRTHVVLIEDLKTDSQVVKAINNSLSGNSNPPLQQQQQPATQPQVQQPAAPQAPATNQNPPVAQ